MTEKQHNYNSLGVMNFATVRCVKRIIFSWSYFMNIHKLKHKQIGRFIYLI